MNRTIGKVSAVFVTVFAVLVFFQNTVLSDMPHLYDFTMKDIDGKDVSIISYAGKVVLIVNVASKCGLTPQYDDLQKLYEKYGDKGFIILGFPANNFAGQEPGTNVEIKQFCPVNYGVTFPMFSKISVKGDDMHALYKFLTAQKSYPKPSGDISWNFEKFLIDRNGNIINRFTPKTEPLSEEIIRSLEAVLSQE